jgi:hypothetical protein
MQDHDALVGALRSVMDSGEVALLEAALAGASRSVRGDALRGFLTDALAEHTPLQRHLLPFDVDGDYRLSWSETRAGFRVVGLGSLIATAVATASHVVMGFASSDRFGSWNISLARAEKARHAADTGAYAEALDAEALKAKVDGLMDRFDTDRDGWLRKPELRALVAANIAEEPSRSPLARLVGGTASRMEFGVLLRLAGIEQPDGTLAVDAQTLHDLYGGTLMYALLPDRELAAAVVRARSRAIDAT